MEQPGTPFGGGPSEATPPQDPFSRPLTAPFGDHPEEDEDEEQWEYEYSTTETEVPILFQ
jgi:hypothetical protein